MRKAIDRLSFLMRTGAFKLEPLSEFDYVVYRSEIVSETHRGHVTAGFAIAFNSGRSFRISMVGCGTEALARLAAIHCFEKIGESGLASIAFARFADKKFAAVFSEITSEVL